MNTKDIKKLTMKDLHELINTSTDLKILDAAEQEYINRTCSLNDFDYELSTEENDEL